MIGSVADELWGTTREAKKRKDEEREREKKEHADKVDKAVEIKISEILSRAEKLAQQGKDRLECVYYTHNRHSSFHAKNDENFTAYIYGIIREMLREERYGFQVTYLSAPHNDGRNGTKKHTLTVSWKPSAKK